MQLHDDLLDFVAIEALDPNALRNTVEGLLAALNNAGDVVRERLSQITQQRANHDQSASQARAADEATGLALPGVSQHPGPPIPATIPATKGRRSPQQYFAQ